MNDKWKGRLKFLTTMPGVLLGLMVVFAILATVLWAENHISNVLEEKRAIAELETKTHLEITPSDFRGVFKMSPGVDQNKILAHVNAGKVKWLITQGHEKDSSTLKVIGRYNIEVKGKAQFFHATPTRLFLDDLDRWAKFHGADVANVPAEPEPASQGIVDHIKSGPGLLALGLLVIFAVFFAWSFLWGPMSGGNRFAKGRELSPEKNNTRFSDVAGIEEKLNEAREAVDILV